MPQASDDLRDLMGLMFNGERISDGPPIEFLLSKGYKLREDWTWELPNKDHHILEKEELCLRFLTEEWDFGGIFGPGEPKVHQ